MSSRRRDQGTIIVRRSEEVAGGHHGGAWKVAYADFVTAMMAFFLLMWLLNATTQEQRRGLADYFSPTNHLATTTSGSGAPFGGRTPNSDGPLQSDQGQVQIARTQPYPVVEDDDTGDQPTAEDPSKRPGEAPRPSANEGGAAAARQAPPPNGKPADARAPQPDATAQAGLSPQAQARLQAQMQAQVQAQQAEQRNFQKAAVQIKDAIASDPALADSGKQLMVEVTPEGLRIQLLDSDRAPMFSTGSAAVNERARAMIARIAPILLRLPEPIAIAGHTDAAPYHSDSKTNWDLSSERANATRRILIDAGLPELRLRSVTGNADRDPLIKDNPLDPANRRVSILLLPMPQEAKR